MRPQRVRRGVAAPLHFDASTGTLWSGNRPHKLRPKAGAVLHYLGARPGQVVGPDELLAAVWPGVNVSAGVIKVHVWEIRRALGDRHRPPRFIETLPKRGYRWLAAPLAVPGDRSTAGSVAGAPWNATASTRDGRIFVGRERDIERLDDALARALAGDRRVVFVTGEPGIGKTTLADAFLRRIADRPDVTTASGQCFEHSGSPEPYLPVLAALGELGRGDARRRLVRVLRRHAPAWLPQLPSLGVTIGGDGAAGSGTGATRTRPRMLRELAEAVETFTARRGLVLVLEDLQWGDASTLDLLSFVARRPGRARLLVVATYRPEDVREGAHPLAAVVQDLAAHGLSSDLPLSFWGEAEVARYLALRIGDATAEALATLATAILERTEGNPLFVANVVDELLGDPDSNDSAVARVAGAETRVRDTLPSSLRRMIERRIERLPREEQAMLEAASAIGAELSAATLAAALETGIAEAEERCALLARRGRFLSYVGSEEWPDGTIAGRYTFTHALYRAVLESRLTPARRVRLHRRIAERLERGYGERAGEIAHDLADQFAGAREAERARRWLEVAAESALRRNAEVEAARYLSRALELLRATPESEERTRRELGLLLRLGAPLLMTRGYGAPEVVAAYRRALGLCAEVGDSPELLMALAGVFRFSLVRSELGTARSLAEQAMRFAERNPFPIAQLAAHFMMGMATLALGEFALARYHLSTSLACYDPAQHRLLAMTYGDDPGVACLAERAMALWFLGHPDQALRDSQEAVARAREGGLPYSLAFALTYAVWSRILRREPEAALDDAEALVRLAVEHGFEYWVAQGSALRGWVRVECGDIEGGIADLTAGLDGYATLGAEVMRPWHLAKLAEAHGRAGRRAESHRTIDAAMIAMGSKEERFFEAEVLRLNGDLRLGAAPDEEIERGFLRALELSRRQEARSLELRAAMSLARLWIRLGRRGEARELLAGVHAGFREGFDTRDLIEARALLASLG